MRISAVIVAGRGYRENGVEGMRARKEWIEKARSDWVS